LVNILLYVLLILCFFVFFNDLKEIHKEDIEYLKSIGGEEIKQYIEKTFGKGNFTILKSMVDENGKLGHIIYLPRNEWFKSENYEWYDVYATNNGYSHKKAESLV
jgi:hypothetical protein